MIFIFSIIASLQCSVNFLLYSKVTQLHMHVYLLFSHITMLHHKWLDIVPSALWQDLIAYPLQRQQFASMNPRLPVHPTPSPSPLATTSLFSMSVSLFLFYKQVHLCYILDTTYKWYYMIFVFLFQTHFT